MNLNDEIFNQAKDLATEWQAHIDTNREKSEAEFHEIMQRMLKDPVNKVFLIELLDQSFRSNNPKRIADQLEYIFAKYSNTSFFTDFEKLLVVLFRNLGIYMSNISVPLFIKYLRNDISDIVIHGEESKLNKHLKSRSSQKTRVNINIIGEAVLGEEEAKERVHKYIESLKNPNIDYVSIKVSTIFSQINPLAHEWSVNKIAQRLEKIYEAAMPDKFINLDMEEYKDVNLTLDVFMKTLSLPKFKSLHAGIVLQAYVPDTLEHLKRLSAWAKQRVQDGGAPIKVRLVKGANQEMEMTEASLRGWPCVTYMDKAETDANYKVLMDYIISPEVTPYVHVGIASHNLFDHALGYLLAKKNGVTEYYSAEMLEGMSETAYKLLKKEGLEVILYAPTATGKTFTNAIAYLVRRFDENTAEQNFLRHSFGLNVESDAWKTLLKSYDDALLTIPNLHLEPYRTQDRNIELVHTKIDVDTYEFENESDTDFSLPKNHIWAQGIADKYKNISKEGGVTACSVIGSLEVKSDKYTEIIDKSQYHEKVVVGGYYSASKEDLQKAVKVAKEDPDGWSALSSKERQKILMNVANNFQDARADLIGIAAAEVGKVFSETDVEVSEAIDFLNFYPYSVRKFEDLKGLHVKEKGVGLVVSPWNFPIAIPVGGIAAALAAGNTVILKPSSDAILCGQMLCQCFWDAGVSKNTLQFVVTSGALAGEHLIPNEDIDFVIFTGGEDTAYDMIKIRPDINLIAETGGKDATIVTALADRDQAVKNVVASAFNNSGQKCSATSLLVLEKELYDDEEFKTMLIDTASSLEVGSVWDFQNRIGTLVNKPRGKLLKSLDYLDDGEEWAIKPSYADDNPYMLKPSIRYGTKKGDFCHMNELFGPVLSVIRADDLEDAIDIVNSTGYGLTSGIESLDSREQEIFKEKLLAGNLYMNRSTTGAIVLRQPFGGMGKSSIGSGKKAGGFNYVSQFMDLSFDGDMEEHKSSHPYIDRVRILLDDNSFPTLKNFAYWLEKEFLSEHDYTNIRGESNVFRYLHVESVLFRFTKNNSKAEMISSIAAAKMAGVKVHVSVPSESSENLSWLENKKDIFLDEYDDFVIEDNDSLEESIKKVQRVRDLDKEPFIAHARVEMMHYFVEQSISNSYHRYGNLGIRGME
ncbi:bifunctional proline dehydrogenase/L-glutamate gamma-semialdehyde dehydrogenase [Sulfurimonas sp.]|nr:bifunctional proline dehydrogenase/L-glutamate gamma-semialdehyde dehydrogenase [Sulfurimonas sp.]